MFEQWEDVTADNPETLQCWHYGSLTERDDLWVNQYADGHWDVDISTSKTGTNSYPLTSKTLEEAKAQGMQIYQEILTK